MLFQGQEFASSSDFHFFADHDGELGELGSEGARGVHGAVLEHLRPRPGDSHPRPRAPVDLRALQARLVRAREERGDRGSAPRSAAVAARGSGVAASGAPRRRRRGARAECVRAALLRRRGRRPASDRQSRAAAIMPTRCPSRCSLHRLACEWATMLSTEDPKYGGWGTPPLPTSNLGWWIPNEFAALLSPSK